MIVTTLTWAGKTLTIKEWSRELNIPTSTLYSRLRDEWPVEFILSGSKFNYVPITRVYGRLKKV